MSNIRDTVNVYWSPFVVSSGLNSSGDWSMLYPEPTNLYSDISKLKVVNSGSQKSFFVCPSIKDVFKNTYVFKNTIYSEYDYDLSNDISIVPKSQNFIEYDISRKPAIETGPIIKFKLSYIFFADQDLDVFFSSPTFHKPEYTNYGSIFPGQFNIGSWFRPYHFEVQMWYQSGKFIIKEDEPIFYARFLTNKKINLNRFSFNDKLFNYSDHCSNSSLTMKANIPLIERYHRFKESKMNYAILKEIKNNLILDEERN
jgi:hypothetical protein